MDANEKHLRAQLEAARGLLRDIYMTCNLREMPSEYAIRDISNQIEALLTATLAPEVQAEQAEQGERQEVVAWLLHLPDGRTTLEKGYPKWAEGEGDGYAIQPLYTTPQPGPDMRGLVEALEWYEQHAAGCRKLTSEGDECRQALDSDGGKRAQTALAAHRQAQRKGNSHDR